MGKLRFKLSHVIARSWFARLRRAYRLKPGVQLHSLVPFSSSVAANANNMSGCSGRSSWSNDDDNHNKAEAEAEDMGELHKWIITERERLSLKQQLHKQDKQGKKKKVYSYPLRSYNSWCRREAPKNVEESCHYKIPSKKKKEESEESWQREGFWSVIAHVGDAKIVRKTVVLKKRMNRGALAVGGVLEGQRAPVNSDNSEEDDRKSAKNSTQQQSQSSASSSCSSSSNNFRLSTCSSSSGNASLRADALAWEKEHYSPFAASDKSSNTDHALGTVSKGAFLFLGHDQSSDLQENKGLCCTKSPSKHRRWESSCCFENHLEASTRAWDDNLGVITSALMREEDVPHEGGGGRAKVGESVAVSMFSSDPYQDFKQSMMQMIVEKRLFKAVELEELLERYLCLNSPGYHDLIVQVFSDLWLQVF